MTATVAAVRSGGGYPDTPPYDPSTAYPELPSGRLTRDPNHAYAAVRDVLATLGLDRDHLGSSQWNPLGSVIEPGMTVVLKPNFVLSRHAGGGDLWAIVTHASVLRAVADYCVLALRGEGRLVIADAPQYDCNWSDLMDASGLPRVLDAIGGRGLDVACVDLRRYWSARRHFPSMVRPLPGDPAGSVEVDVGPDSALAGKDADRFYGAVYHREETIAAHSGGRHRYEVSGTVLGADAVVSVPKLKVHKKVGVTLNLKNLVGICTNKNHLVHYSLEPPARGGDQYPDGHFAPVEERLIRTERWMYDHLLASRRRLPEYLHRSAYWLHDKAVKPFGVTVEPSKRLEDAGNWYGNDSAWRMTIDLYRIALFGSDAGGLRPTPQRRWFSVVDGIIGGEGNGPLQPDAVASGTVVAGADLLAVDLVATRLMGFDPLLVPAFRFLTSPGAPEGLAADLADVVVASDTPEWRGCLSDPASTFLGFRPHPGWAGHLRIEGVRGVNA
jgi:uncharacterized protein (DUF362 family)